jgi:N-methylhydantoinase B
MSELMSRQVTVDPITLAVISGALTSAVNEMTVVVERTARSPIVAISHDYSNALYTAVNGVPEMIVQGPDQPCHLGGMLRSVKSAADRFPTLANGDVIVGNLPDLNGTHLLDVDLIMPIYFDDQLVGWACSRAHEIDLGGPVAGGYNPEAEELYAEALAIPPIKLVEAGRVREDIWELILANVRAPELLRGDMGAQLSAVRVAARRVQQLCARYGVDVVLAATRDLLDRGERLMRAQIAAMPDSVYTGEQWIQDDGRGTPDSRIGCTIEVLGDNLQIAIESPPVCRSYRNSYWGLTLGAVFYAVLSGVEPGLPINEGLYRPIHVEPPPAGTMLNPNRPAACQMSTADVWAVVFDAVCDALSSIAPERAYAGWQRVALFGVTGIDPRYGEYYGGALHIACMGGAGACHGMDGGGLWGIVGTGGASTTGDVELLEFRMPLHFEQHELQVDSACPGRWRGSPGAVLEFEVVDHRAQVSHVGDGTKFPAASRRGGGSPRDRADRVHKKFIIHRDRRREPIPMHSLRDVEAGERVLCFLPGGGGLEPASDRDPQSVALDVAAGLVSVESAREEYGVLLDEATSKVDTDATSALRARLSGAHGPVYPRE